MAIYHLSAQIISRSVGRSVTAAAAYRTRGQIHDRQSGLSFDYSYIGSADYCEILAPAQAQDWVYNREVLWNKVEAAERRKDSQLAREINIALPVELSKEEKIELGLNFVKNQYVSQGMVADIAFHDLESHNPHFHVMLTTRQLEAEGFALTKEKAWRPDFAYGKAKSELLVQERSSWQDYANAALSRARTTERIDHRTLEAQGLERIPQIHLGAQVAAMERKGISTTVGDEYRQIEKANAELAILQIRADINRHQIESEKELEKLRIEKQREEEQKQEEEQRNKEQERLRKEQEQEKQRQRLKEAKEIILKAISEYGKDTEQSGTDSIFENHYFKAEKTSQLDYGRAWMFKLTVFSHESEQKILEFSGETKVSFYEPEWQLTYQNLGERDYQNIHRTGQAIEHLTRVKNFKEYSQEIIWKWGDKDRENPFKGWGLFEDNNYRIVTDKDWVKVTAFDGRGEIFKCSNNPYEQRSEFKAEAKFTENDYQIFEATYKRFEQRRREAERQQQLKRQQNRGRGFER